MVVSLLLGYPKKESEILSNFKCILVWIKSVVWKQIGSCGDLTEHKWVLLDEAKPEEDPTVVLWPVVGPELTGPDKIQLGQVKLP